MCESHQTGCVHSPRRVQRSATFLAVAAFFLIGWLNDSNPQSGQWKQTFWFIAVYLTPPLVALIAVRRDTPLYLFAAGVVMFPMSLVSIVLIPALLVVAVMVSGTSGYLPLQRGSEVEIAGFFVIVVGTFRAFSLMLAGSGPAILLGLVPLAIVLAMATVRAPRTPAPVDPESPHRPTADLPA
jgi:hypothetical protein